MASISWCLVFLAVSARTVHTTTSFDAPGVEEVTKSVHAIKTASHSDGGEDMVKTVKTATVKTSTGGGTTKTIATVTKTLPDDIDPFSIQPNLSSGGNTNGGFMSTVDQTQGSRVAVEGGGTLNVAKSGGTTITKTKVTTTKSVNVVGHTGGSGTHSGGLNVGTRVTLPTLGTGGITFPGAPGHTGVSTNIGVHGSGRNVPPVLAPFPSHGAPVGLSNAPASSVLTSRTTNSASTISTGLNLLHSGIRMPHHGAPAVGVTGSGVEVEVPGYTTGLGRKWKWVLGRRTGIFPPYIQAIDPDILYHKLGYPNPQLPVVPASLQKILNTLPLRPVGSTMYGYPVSTRMTDIIRRLTRITALRNLLSSNKLAKGSNTSKILTSLLTSETSSPLGGSPLERLLLQSDSSSSTQPGQLSSLLSLLGSDPYGFPFSSPNAATFGAPYGSFYGGPYGMTYGNPWPVYPSGSFPGSSWPYYPGSPIVPFAPYGPGSGIYPVSSFGPYGISSSLSYPGVPGYGGSSSSGSILSTLIGANSGKMGVRYVQSPDGTLVPVSGPLSSSSSTSDFSISDFFAHPRQYTVTPDGQLVHKNDIVLHEGRLPSLLSDPSNPLYPLLKSTSASKTVLGRLLRSRGTHPSLLLKLFGKRPSSSLYNTILKQIIFNRRPAGIFGSSINSLESDESGPDGSTRMISLLRNAISNPNDVAAQYLAGLVGISPESIRLSGSSRTPLDSTVKTLAFLRGLRQPTERSDYDTLTHLLLGSQEPVSSMRSRLPLATSEAISPFNRYNTFSESQSPSEETPSFLKEIADVLLPAGGPRKTTVGTKETVVTKTVTHPRIYASALARPPTSETRLTSSTFSSGEQPTLPSSITPTASGYHVTEQRVQSLSSPTLLGLKNVPGVSSATQVPFYGTTSLHPLFTTGTRVTSTPGVFVNGQFVSSSNGLLGSTLGQTGLTVPFTTGSYTTAIPVSNGFVSAATSSHPYLMGGSAIGGHPHYVVEGHEAPGTRWQLKVWRHHPGVSAIVPGTVCR
ncbi:uncharacterized protein LOC125943934 [Dermacentor silvarum]|uniref:uncharacterized protein LOC125943934 n=1 Tax=Dermacentor silvarum TaxID=543639 RepID=UPI0021019BDC|nr:uncharacterized protein LOC125943934 [Dermacentor silvarum]